MAPLVCTTIMSMLLMSSNREVDVSRLSYVFMSRLVIDRVDNFLMRVEGGEVIEKFVCHIALLWPAILYAI